MWVLSCRRDSPAELALRSSASERGGDRGKRQHEREERGKGIFSKKGNGKPTGRLRSALPQWCTHSLFLFFFLSFSSFPSDFSNVYHRMEGGGWGVCGKEIERKKSEGWKGGMQRWKRVVVISSFGRGQIIKHFLKPISALMYVCVDMCVQQ